MTFDNKYIAACKKDVHDLTKIHPRYWAEPRYQILKKFCEQVREYFSLLDPNYIVKILSVGCGPKEPIMIKASHALDLVPDGELHLRRAGWKGEFKVGSCTSLPYKKKSFDIVVCSEVIEHMPTIEDVIKTFQEVNRVGKRWIITTPNSDVNPPKEQNPAHLQFFTSGSSLSHIDGKNIIGIKNIIPFPCKIYLNDHHIYIESLSND